MPAEKTAPAAPNKQTLLATNVSISLSYCHSSMPDESNRLKLTDARTRKMPPAHALVLPRPACHALDVRPVAARRSSIDQPFAGRNEPFNPQPLSLNIHPVQWRRVSSGRQAVSCCRGWRGDFGATLTGSGSLQIYSGAAAGGTGAYVMVASDSVDI